MSSALLEHETAIAEPSTAIWAPRVSYFDPHFRQYVAAELDRLRHLQTGWDGYHAPVVNQAVIDAARNFIFDIPQNIVPRPRVVPLASGSLQFEWTSGDVALELEFESPTIIRYLKWNPSVGQPEEETVPLNAREELEEILRWFARQ